MKKIIASSSILLGIILCMWGCQKEDIGSLQALTLQLPDVPFHYTPQDLPNHFKQELRSNHEDMTFQENNSNNAPEQALNITDDGATLGRVLFYDPQLSLNNRVACGSCHHQSRAFADGKVFSEGFKGKMTKRNSMSIANPVLNEELFWDSRVHSIQDLVLEPVQNHIEMGMESLDKLPLKLTAVDYYPALFEKAFGTNAITTDRIGDALSQFLRSMLSYDSPFDRGLQNNFADFTPKEQLGRELFFSQRLQCASCHRGANFAAPNRANSFSSFDNIIIGDMDNIPFDELDGYRNTRGTTNIGLDLDYADEGMGRGQFRIPSLRNIALTAPYMHDGRFANLMEVIDHYDSNIRPHENLDSKFKGANGLPQQLGLTNLEKEALIAFLHTLTDEHFIKDQKFSNPFQ